jgi:hypothetical protein
MGFDHEGKSKKYRLESAPFERLRGASNELVYEY